MYQMIKKRITHGGKKSDKQSALQRNYIENDALDLVDKNVHLIMVTKADT